MKIAVYTIALNEEKFVERWYESAKDADYLLIADTGSTDKTVRIAKKLGINVIKISIKPWRFDDARNAALAVLPDDIDYCVSMDMDETLSEGWRKCLEKMTGDQIEYKFNLTFKDEAEKVPETTFINNRIHKRHGFRWEFLMHEVVIPDRIESKAEFCEGLEVSHHPDKEKSREQYNQMIEDSYHKYNNARYHIYQAQQLIANNRLDEAKVVLKSLTKLEDATKIDIALAYRLLGLMSKKLKTWYFLKSLIKYRTRETYSSLAAHYYSKSKWFRTYYFGKKADSIKIKTSSILKDPSVWGLLPTNLMLVGKHNMKLNKFSRSYKVDKKEINMNSIITYKFKLFND